MEGNETSLTYMTPAQRKFNILFKSCALNPGLSAYGNINSLLLTSGLPGWSSAMTLNPQNCYWSHETVMGSMMEIFMSWLPQCIWRWCNDQKRCQWWQLNVPLPSQPPSYILRHRMTKGSPRVTWRKTVAMDTRSGASLFLFTPPCMPPACPTSSSLLLL